MNYTLKQKALDATVTDQRDITCGTSLAIATAVGVEFAAVTSNGDQLECAANYQSNHQGHSYPVLLF